MKRISLILLTTILISTKLYAYVGEHFSQDGINFTITDEDAGTCKVKSGTSTYVGDGDYETTPGCPDATGYVIIPDKIWHEGKEYKVTAIGELAFSECPKITNVVIPSTVTTIERLAFAYSRNIKSITIPESVTTIENAVFSFCSGLTSVILPENLKAVTGFAGCTGLTSVRLPQKATSISSYAFDGCYALKEIIIPQSVTFIGNNAFSRCRLLEYVVIPDGIKEICDHTFEDCTGLMDVYLPNSIEKIGTEAFYNTGLKKVAIPNSVTYVGPFAFRMCQSLRTMYIPESITSMVGCFSQSYMNFNELYLPHTTPATGLYNYFKSSARKIYVPIGMKQQYTANAADTQIEELEMGLIPSEEEKVLSVGESFRLNYSRVPEFIPVYSVQWVSDDPSVAYVDNSGTVSAISPGETNVYAVGAYGKGNLSAQSRIIVPDDNQTSLMVDTESNNTNTFYLNLQGHRVDNPTNGALYIKISGITSQKIIYQDK